VPELELTIDPDHPLVERVRTICLGFPDAVESRSWGRPTFKVNRIFAFVGSSMDRPHSVAFKPDPEERRAYLQDERFFVPPYWGPFGWLAMDIEADSADNDWAELAELLETSYRQLALKRQVKALDELTS
jgi:hypothetical protein